MRVLTDPATWGTHHDLTGPRLLAWPEAMRLLSGELGEQVSFVTATERELLRRLTSLGIPPGQAELLITREWALLAGESERTTNTVQGPDRAPAPHRRGPPAREPRAVPLTVHATATRRDTERSRQPEAFPGYAGRSVRARKSFDGAFGPFTSRGAW